MLKDLKAYQAGLIVSAHDDSVKEKARRWYRAHGKQMWISLLLIGLSAALIIVIYAQRIKESTSWGTPQLVEDFMNDDWKNSWIPFQGAFVRDHEKLITTGRSENIIFCNRKFIGATAIEYDAENLQGNPSCDLSLIWSPDLVFNGNQTQVKDSILNYRFQLGANDGSYSLITRCTSPDGLREHLSYSPLRPLTGKTYHVRVEIADSRMQMLVDGKVICTWTQPFTFTSGYIGLYGHYPGKAFRHVRIYSRGIPQKVSATAIGDSFLLIGRVEEAGNAYAWVASSNPGTAVGREAIYKEGICLYQEGRFDRAFAIWKPLRSTEYDAQIRLQDIDRLAGDGNIMRHCSKCKRCIRFPIQKSAIA